MVHSQKDPSNSYNSIFLDITNPGYQSSASNEKAFLIIYGLKRYQNDVSGSFYDHAFIVNNGNTTLLANLDLNGFSLKN